MLLPLVHFFWELFFSNYILHILEDNLKDNGDDADDDDYDDDDDTDYDDDADYDDG